MTQPELSIVIVNWNVSNELVACLDSIEAHAGASEVIVVDNASSDGSVDLIGECYPWVRLIANHQNLGFAKANNQGFAAASGEFILLLNPDSRLMPNALENMLEHLRGKPRIGLVGPRIIDENGEVVRPCRRPPVSLRQVLKGLFLTDKLFYWTMKKLFGRRFVRLADRRFYRDGPTGCLQGSCMLMRKSDIEVLGGFDERVPMYLDDGDLCARYRANGMWVYFCAHAEILHTGGSSVHKLANPRMSSLIGSLALDIYFLKHHGPWHVALHHGMLLASSVIFLIIDIPLLVGLFFWRRKLIPQYMQKHFWTLCYSLCFRYSTDVFPKAWPRSLARAWRQKS